MENKHPPYGGDDSRAGGDDGEADRFTEVVVGHKPADVRGRPHQTGDDRRENDAGINLNKNLCCGHNSQTFPIEFDFLSLKFKPQ